MSIYKIIEGINSSLSGLVKGAEWLGVAGTVDRGGVKQPVINEKPAGPDDKVSVRVYHKLGTLTSKIAPGSGYGSSVGNQVNTYTNSMVVFINRQRGCKFYPDELMLMIQAALPELMVLKPYDRVALSITRTDLDSESVYAQELSSPFKLKQDQYFFRITYTVETTFKKGCFATC